MSEKEETKHYDSPSVLAYRVGQLEKTVSTGLTKLETKLDIMQAGFVKREDLDKIEEQVTAEHDGIRADIDKVRGDVHKIKKWKDGIIAKVATAAVVMLVFMVLALYGLDQFFKP